MSEANMDALKRASSDLRELLLVASKTASLIADSLEPDCSPETHEEIIQFAKRYGELVVETREILLAHANMRVNRLNEVRVLPEYVGDSSLAARTEAEIAARKATVLKSRLEEACPFAVDSQSNAMDIQPPML